MLGLVNEHPNHILHNPQRWLIITDPLSHIKTLGFNRQLRQFPFQRLVLGAHLLKFGLHCAVFLLETRDDHLEVAYCVLVFLDIGVHGGVGVFLCSRLYAINDAALKLLYPFVAFFEFCLQFPYTLCLFFQSLILPDLGHETLIGLPEFLYLDLTLKDLLIEGLDLGDELSKTVIAIIVDPDTFGRGEHLMQLRELGLKLG